MTRIVNGLLVVAKALLIAGAVMWLGSYVGISARDAGGSRVIDVSRATAASALSQ